MNFISECKIVVSILWTYVIYYCISLYSFRKRTRSGKVIHCSSVPNCDLTWPSNEYDLTWPSNYIILPDPQTYMILPDPQTNMILPDPQTYMILPDPQTYMMYCQGRTADRGISSWYRTGYFGHFGQRYSVRRRTKNCG